MIGYRHVFCYQSIGTNDTEIADHGTIQDSGMHAHQYIVAKRGTMDNSAMTHNAIFANGNRVPWVNMHHGIFLNVAPVADPDLIAISPDHRTKPHRALIAKRYLPEDPCRI